MAILGLTGLSGVGKTTCARALAEEGWIHCSFALPLRAFVYERYELDYSLWGDKGYEHTPLKYGPVEGATPQQLLIREGASERAHDSWVWVRYVALLLSGVVDNKGARVVFDDVRQANEALFIRNLGGSLLELRRRGIEREPQALDGDLHLLGGEVIDLDGLPDNFLPGWFSVGEMLALAYAATPRTRLVILGRLGNPSLLNDEAMELMNQKFAELNA